MTEPTPPTSPQTPLEREPARVQVLFHGHLLASSTDVLVAKTAGQPATRYFPRADVFDAFLRRTDVSGTGRDGVTWYTLYRDGEIKDHGAWSFETAQGDLAGRIAFRDELVEFEVLPLGREEIDEIVRHTDSGSGASQAEHWPANVRPARDGEPGAPGRPFKDVGAI